MRRLALLGSSLVLISAAALAQDQPPPATTAATLRVSIASGVTLEGDEEGNDGPNLFQYFLWERLNAFGLRVDSLKKIGDPRLDPYIEKSAKKWEKKEPGSTGAAFKIEAIQSYRYDGAVFYGEVQAHNFHGKMDVTIKGADDKVVRSISFPFSWGRPVSKGTKSEVRRQVDQLVQTAVVLGILTTPEIKAGITNTKDMAALDKFVKEQKESLLKLLEGSTKAMAESELANFVRSIEI